MQKHGEVFTPKWMVNRMLNEPGIKEACQDPGARFLEPAAGEGAFLRQILKRKLKAVTDRIQVGQIDQAPPSFEQIEGHLLLALSSLYGIELLEDNARQCAINLFYSFTRAYEAYAKAQGRKTRPGVLKSAQFIISKNIMEGDFLKRSKTDGQAIIFSEWEPLPSDPKRRHLYVQRTEYSLQEIYDGLKLSPGRIYCGETPESPKQISIFDLLAPSAGTEQEVIPAEPLVRYQVCRIDRVYLEKVEEVHGQDLN